MGETGHVEGSNVSIDFQWAYGDLARYKELAAELVRRQVAVIVTPLGTTAAVAAKAATTTVPIVFSSGTDPVQVGLVPSLKRPGGNLTGVNYMQSELGANGWACYTNGAARLALRPARQSDQLGCRRGHDQGRGNGGGCDRAASRLSRD